ncbi:hypothetical protein ACFPPD_23305 [Cohnella suwonensis]|uniref:Uncharacterized protein n=1 Tax=Cohnella suwonensis TaxID=696072 RepID=A0ABW0M337_9BACL
MKVTIIGFNNFDDKIKVTFLSDLGVGIGYWNGVIPKVNNTYFVELDIQETLVYGSNIVKSSNQPISIFNNEGITKIIGKIEFIEDDCIILRIGKSIIMTEVDNLKEFNQGDTVIITTTNLLLIDMNF